MADEELHEADDNMQSAAGEKTSVTVTEVVVDEAPEPDTSASLDADILEESDEAADELDNANDIPMDKLEAVLNANVDKHDMTPQMRRMMQRQQDNTRRVEETIKGTKANPRWFVPLFCALMIIGLVWAVVFYLTYDYPIPGIGQWNLAIALALIMVGFIMTMWWR